jgi:hypothetical protein
MKNIVKTIILIACLLFYFIDSRAQNTGPNELHCTEEAITFKTDVRSGWHFSSPGTANPHFTNPNTTGSFAAVKQSDYLLPSSLWPLLIKNTQDPGRHFQLKSSPIPFKYAFPIQDYKFSYNFYPIIYHPVFDRAKSLLSSPAF